jgi:hypothetical protein
MTEKEALIRIHAQDTRRGIVHAVRNKPPSRRRLNNRIGPLLQIPNQLFFSALKTRFSASV